MSARARYRPWFALPEHERFERGCYEWAQRVEVEVRPDGWKVYRDPRGGDIWVAPGVVF